MTNVAQKLAEPLVDVSSTESAASKTPIIQVVSQTFGASVSAVETGAPLSVETAPSAEEAVGRLVRKRWPLAIKDEFAGLSDHELGSTVLKEQRLRNLQLEFLFLNVDHLS